MKPVTRDDVDKIRVEAQVIYERINKVCTGGNIVAICLAVQVMETSLQLDHQGSWDVAKVFRQKNPPQGE